MQCFKIYFSFWQVKLLQKSMYHLAMKRTSETHKDVWNTAWWLIWKSTGEMYRRCNKWSRGESYGIWQWVEWWGNGKSACGSAKTCKSFAHFANDKNFGDHLRHCSYTGIELDITHLFYKWHCPSTHVSVA